MKIYAYVARTIREHLGLTDIFGSTKTRKMKKGFADLQEQGISFGIKTLDQATLDAFDVHLYQPQIATKTNAEIFDISTYLETKKKDNISLLFAYIEKDDKLLGGCVFFYGKNGRLSMCYKATENIIVSGVGLGFYIDHIILEDAITKGAPILSRGRDRNAYGLIGANPGLVIQKAQTKFLPYQSTNTTIIDIDEKTIHTETLIFDEPDSTGVFRKAIFWTKDPDSIKNKFSVLTSLGIEIVIHLI